MSGQDGAGEFERANDLTGARIELPPDTPDDQEPLFLALDSVHHDDRIVPPTIDENYIQVLGQSNVELDNFSVGAERTQVEEEEEDTLNNSGRVAQPGAGASSSGGLRHNRSETRGAPCSTQLVGRAFEENRNVIWSWLTDDEVSIIGIYGMAGAGKTTLLKHICNELPRSPDIYYHVYWVTLSPDFSIHKLQNKIAKSIQLSFSNEEEELGLRAEKLSQKLMKKQRCWKEEELGRRAKELSQELMKKPRWILILDNLCNSFKLDEVGIPLSLKGCKLIMITRSDVVCRQMNSRNNVRVNPLSREEAWTLWDLQGGFLCCQGQGRKRIETAPLKSGWTLLMTNLILEMASAVFDQLGYAFVGMVLAFVALLLSTAELIHMARKGRMSTGKTVGTIVEYFGWMNDGGNSTHKTMGKRRKRIVIARSKSGRASAISAYAQEQNNVDMAQQREPLLTGEFERANDLTGAGIELPHDTPDNQDELKKLKGSKSRDMVDDFKSKLIGAVSASAREQNNVEMAQQQESLLTGEFERANDLTAAGIERPRDTPDDQDDFKSRWTLLMTNLILEMASAVFDQLGNALVGMVLAFVALLLSTAELIYMEIMARRESRSLLPCKPVGTIVEYFGLVGAVWQCFYSTVEYAYARQKKNNPIKMCLLTFIFLSCVVISKLIKKSHIEQMNDGGNSTHKTMGKRRKRIEMAPSESGRTSAVSASAQEQNNVDMAQQRETLLTGEFERANDLTGAGIERPRDTPDDQDEVKKLKGSRCRDMLGYALVGMVLAFVALLVATADLIHMAPKERMSPSTTTLAPGKPGGTIVEYFGLVGAVWQCVYSTVEYAYARQKKDNPIKMCLLPFIFLLCVVISKLKKKSHID